MWTTLDGKIMVPEPLVQKVMHAHHASPLAGHTGKDKTLELLSRYFLWPSMSDAVHMYLSERWLCQRSKAYTKKKQGLLQSMQILDARWETISLDLVTELPTSQKGRNAVLSGGG